MDEVSALESKNLGFEDEIVNNLPEASATVTPTEELGLVATVKTEELGLVATVDEAKLYKNNDLEKTKFNGLHDTREWGVCTQMVDIYRSGSNNKNQISRLDVDVFTKIAQRYKQQRQGRNIEVICCYLVNKNHDTGPTTFGCATASAINQRFVHQRCHWNNTVGSLLMYF